MQVDTGWFRDRLADKRMSQRRLASMLGMDPAALSLTLRGRRLMKLTEAADLARLLGAPIEEVLAHAGVERESRGHFVPIAGWIDGVGECHLEHIGEVDRPTDVPLGATAYQCRTAGTELDYMDGWLLFTGHVIEPPPMDHVGRLCLARIAGGMIMLAQLRRGYKAGRWNLNGPGAGANDVVAEWSAPVLAIRT